MIGRLVEEKWFRAELVSSRSLLIRLMKLVKDRRGRNRSMMFSVEGLKWCLSWLTAAMVVQNGWNKLSSCWIFVFRRRWSKSFGSSVNTITNTVRLLMRVSEKCTAYAISVLWSVCKLAYGECFKLKLGWLLSFCTKCKTHT